MHIGYDYHYLYLALCPLTGGDVALLIRWKSIVMSTFLREFAADLSCRGIVAEGKTNVRFIADNAGSHHAKAIDANPDIVRENLPVYSPKLNPGGLFEELRRLLTCTVRTSVEEVEKIIIEALRHYWDNPDVQSIILMRKFYTTTDSNMKQQIMENNTM